MNKMKVLANALGIKFGEKFKINGRRFTYFLDDEGLYYTNDEGKVLKEPADTIIYLLTGKCAIEDRYWKPKDGESFWMPDITAEDSIDILYNRGLICKTKEEAKELAKQLILYAKKLRFGDDGECKE